MTRIIDSDDPSIPATGREEAAYREGRIDEHRRIDPTVAPGHMEDAAYREGRVDERRRIDPMVAPGHVEDAAYREGRVDERARTDRVSSVAGKDAYRQGRRDERSRRRGSPLLTLLLLIVVAIGAVLIYFAIQNGSFSSGGAVVDQKLSNAAETVKAPIRGAADKAGTALQNAGSNLKQDAGSGNP